MDLKSVSQANDAAFFILIHRNKLLKDMMRTNHRDGRSSSLSRLGAKVPGVCVHTTIPFEELTGLIEPVGR